jgi:hypothetical protein
LAVQILYCFSSTSTFRAWFLVSATISVVERRQVRIVDVLRTGSFALARRNEVEFT